MNSPDPRGPQAMLPALRDFCAEQVDAEVAARITELARPGFALTPAGPGEAAGNSRFGGRALLEPGIPWPACDGFPLSLHAVLDTDPLAPWLDGLFPPGTGLLNFFYLDTQSEQTHPDAWDPYGTYGFRTERALGCVLPARSAQAVEVDPPARASVFEPIPWAATYGLLLPHAFDPVWGTVDLGPELDEKTCGGSFVFLEEVFPRWSDRPPGVIEPPGPEDRVDLAFGRHQGTTGNGPHLPAGAGPNDYHHLLQLTGNDQWNMGGDGGTLHWAMPTAALHVGDFSQAVPTPDLS
ncbi:DUF1963 domain-containing protein [Streptomyces collinus]